MLVRVSDGSRCPSECWLNGEAAGSANLARMEMKVLFEELQDAIGRGRALMVQHESLGSEIANHDVRTLRQRMLRLSSIPASWISSSRKAILNRAAGLTLLMCDVSIRRSSTTSGDRIA